MPENQLLFQFKTKRSKRPDRTLTIEAEGDAWKGLVKPRIRLMGRWLERAGFNPGNHVHVTCIAPGVIELRSQVQESKSSDKPSGRSL